MNFSFDYGSIDVTPRPPMNQGPLYAAVEGRAGSLGDDEVVFYDPAIGRTHVMTLQVLQALELCREFQPMDVHVQRVCEGLPNMRGQQQSVRRVLDNLATRGLLITDDAYGIRLGRAAATAPADVAGLFVRACDRPNQLAALLDSLAQYARTVPLPYRVVVVDDSRQAASVQAHAGALAAFAQQWPAAVHHVTPALWQGVADDLVADLGAAGHAAAAMLLRQPTFRGRPGGGQGRNLITLLAAGGRYLLFDDDHLLPLHRHPDAKSGLTTRESAWTARTFADADAAIAFGDRGDVDPIGLHLALCGRQLGEALSNGTVALGREQLQGLAPSREPLLRADARIRMTLNGHRGGSCSAGVNWLYMLDAAQRAGYASTEASYLAHRGDPAVWFGTDRYLLDRAAKFPPLAIDNARMLPCTSPFGRSEDALFNALTMVADGDAVQLHLPWAVGHRPEGGRDRTPLLGTAEQPDVNTYLTDVALGAAPDLRADDPAIRVRAMAARFADIAGASDANVVSLVREYVAYRRSALIERLKAAAHHSDDAPPAWQADLRGLIEANGRAIVERGAARMAGWDEGLDAAAAAAAFRREVQPLADGMMAWPDAWAVALRRREDWLERARVRG